MSDCVSLNTFRNCPDITTCHIAGTKMEDAPVHLCSAPMCRSSMGCEVISGRPRFPIRVDSPRAVQILCAKIYIHSRRTQRGKLMN